MSIVLIIVFGWLICSILALIALIISQKIFSRNGPTPTTYSIEESKKLFFLYFMGGPISIILLIVLGLLELFDFLIKWSLTPKPKAEVPLIYQESFYRDSAKVNSK